MSLFIFRWSSTIILVLSKIQCHHLEGKLSRDHCEKEEETHLRVLTVKPSLFASGSKTCKGAVVYSLHAMLLCRLKASDRGETTQRVHEWKRRNIVHIFSLNVWNGKWTDPSTMGAKVRTFLFFFLFSRSSTRQHDYSAGTEREKAWRHRYKMKPDRRYSAAS